MFGTLILGTLTVVAAQDKDTDASFHLDIRVPEVNVQIPDIQIPELDVYVPGYEVHVPSFDFDTDTTFEVDPNGRLELRNHEGDITITTWDRNAIRLEAIHDSEDRVKIQRSGSTVKIRSESRHGHPDEVDYQLTIPNSMAVDLWANESTITVEGVLNGVRVETVDGDVTARNCSGEIRLRSVDGEVTLERATGRFDVSSADGDIWVSDAEGELSAESVDGEIVLESINSSFVEAMTVDGDVVYTGTVTNDGRYRLTTHDGDVRVRIPMGANVTVSVATFEGAFEASFPVDITRLETGQRFSFVLGSGSARMDLQTFDGDIRLNRR